MGRMAGSEGPRRKISVTLSLEAFAMIDEIAASRGGNYCSRIVEEAVRMYFGKLTKDGSLGGRPIKVRPSRFSGGHGVAAPTRKPNGG